MLSINWGDVLNVLLSVMPQLIAIGVVLVLAIIATIAVNKKTVKDGATRKLIHSESWLVFFVAVVVSVAMMVFGPLSTLLNNATATKYTLSEQSIKQANELAKNIEAEAITLLQNNDKNLPLANKKVNVFGWGSTNPIYGGTGSGSMNQNYKTTSLLDGLKEAGIETNADLSKLYTDYRADRPVVGMADQDWTLPELPVAQYPADAMDKAKSFSDEAVIVISRSGGEGADLPMNMKAEGITYTDNSKDYADFKDGEHFLQLSKTEQDMVDMVTKNFDKVTLVYNGANAFELNFVEKYPQIKSVLWVPPAGQTGFSALGEILAGEVNPSGKTSDTFVRDLKTTPTWNNFGDFKYENMKEFGTENFEEGKTWPAFVNYVEGIYVGYKFYETAADEGLINYDDMVQYPFGYGLSYTKFDQKMGDVTYSDGKVSFDVTVTNTGDTAGKDVVEVYYNPPYTNGGIEKASTNLVAFDKTKELAPGESETVKIEFDDDDMASYDDTNAKAWVLEQGDYEISIQSDSHREIASAEVNVPKTITYNSEDNTHNGDKTVATNALDTKGDAATYLSRADHFANYKEATAAPTNFTLSDKYKEEFRNTSNYKPEEYDNDSDEMPTTGANNGVRLADLTGKDYDDPEWDKLLDQLTFEDMDSLISAGGYGTPALKKIGKIALTDVDGPASLNNNFTGVGSIGFPASTAVACTWNKDLAKQFGDMIGKMAHDMHVAGWYAPAMNIHRNAFAGRTFEYFSEDGYLSGVMASSQVAGAQEHGVYAFMKHFALNEQETNRLSMLMTWAPEQTIREIYLKPFEMSVKTGGAGAVMSSFNYIGNDWAGATSGVQNTILRDEWGFRGMVLSDYFGGFGYMQADRAIRGGTDIMLATTDTTNHITDKSATSVKAMRNATHNILYTAANNWLYADGEPKVATPIWQTISYVVIAVAAILFIGLEFLAVKRYLSRKKAAQVEVASAE